MPNALYNSGKQAMLQAQVNFMADNIRVALVNTSYSVALSGHANLTDIAPFVVGSAQLLVNKSVTNGVFDADDVTYSALAAGLNLRAAVIYRDTGTPGTSTLLAYIDQITGFPLATNGGDVTIQWDNGPFRIFSL